MVIMSNLSLMSNLCWTIISVTHSQTLTHSSIISTPLSSSFGSTFLQLSSDTIQDFSRGGGAKVHCLVNLVNILWSPPYSGAKREDFFRSPSELQGGDRRPPPPPHPRLVVVVGDFFSNNSNTFHQQPNSLQWIDHPFFCSYILFEIFSCAFVKCMNKVYFLWFNPNYPVMQSDRNSSKTDTFHLPTTY